MSNKSEEETPPIKVYLISRISPNSHNWIDQVCSRLRPPLQTFIPYKHNPWNLAHEKIENNVYEADLQAMNESEVAVALPEFGNDCSFEVGWFANSRKPLVIFISDQTEWLSDWMVKGGVDVVVTNNKETYAKLCLDPILKYKRLFYIEEMKLLQDIIVGIYEETYLGGFMD